MPKPTFAQLSSKQKKRIYSVCLKLLAANGCRRTTIKAITRRLKVADGYLHYYFTGKDDLIKWAMDVGIEQWMEHCTRCLADNRPDDLVELVKLIVLQQIRFARAHGDIFAAYLSLINERNFPHLDYLLEKISWTDNLFAAAIADAIRGGSVRADAPPELVAMIVDLVATRMQEFAWDPNYDPLGIGKMDEPQIVRLLDQLMGLLRDGFGPRDPALPAVGGAGS
jgi:AcrR family transcriptional regulator